MKLNRTASNWTGLERDKINENWKIIEGLGDDINTVVSGLVWKEPVNTSKDLPSGSDEGDTRMARDSGKVYRFDGAEWVEIQQIDATAINEVDSRLTAQLADTLQDLNVLKINKADRDELYREVNPKADKGYVDNKVADVSSRIDEIITTPVDGVNEQEIIDARDHKDSLGDNIRSIRDKSTSNFENKIKNGSFERNNLNDYGVLGGGGEVVDGIARLTANGTLNRFGAILYQDLLDYVPQNEAWYIRAKIRTIDDGATDLNVGFRGLSGLQHESVIDPIKNTWYETSYIYNEPGSLTGGFRTSIFARFDGNVEGKEIEIDYNIAINLTHAFGRGNEPVREDVDKIIDEYLLLNPNVDLSAGKIVDLLMDRQLKMEKQVDENATFELENSIINGDFSEGLRRWNPLSDTILELKNNKALIKGNNHAIPRMVQIGSIDYDIGDVLFLKGTFTPKNNEVDSVGFAVYSEDSDDNIQYVTLNDLTMDQPVDVYGNVAIPENAYGESRVQVRAVYENAAVATGKVVEVENLIGINLTKTFGKGNEPSADKLNNLLMYYPDDYFIKPRLKDMQKALVQFSFNNKSDSVMDIRKPLIAITFDDGYKTDFEVAFPILQSRGLTATSFIRTDRTDVHERAMTWRQLHELKNAGWGIECHTHDHVHLADLSDQEIHEQMQLVNQAFLDNGFPKPRHHAYPFGSGSTDSRVQNIVMQYRKTARMTNNPSHNIFNEYDNINFKALQARASDIYDGNTDLITQRKEEIDLAIENKGIYILYSHEMKYEGAVEYESLVEYWTEVIDYAIDKNMEFVTMEELYKYVLEYQMFT